MTKSSNINSDPLLSAIDRRIDERIRAAVDSVGPRYARLSTVGLTRKAAIAAATRGDFRVIKSGKYLLVDLATFEAFAACNEVGRSSDRTGEIDDDAADPLIDIAPTIASAFRRAAERAAASEVKPSRRVQKAVPR